jgi:hypothetical protein
LVADSQSILVRWRNPFSQLLNYLGVNDDGQTDLHTVEPLVHEPSAFEVELVTDKLKNHKSPGTDQIPAELVKARGRTHIITIRNKEEFPEEWKETIILPIYKKGDKTDCINCRSYHFCHLHTKFYPTSCSQG